MSTHERDSNEAILDGLRAAERYHVIGLLGQGAVGRVERVYDAHLGRIVARKTLHEGLASKASSLRAFVHEARILGHLDHGGVIPIFDAYVNDAGLPVYTMREISGRSLAQILEMDRREARVVPLPLERTLKIVIQLCEALGHAHERGVVHLDLKPQNIIVLPHDEIVLVDWGAASIYDPERFAEGLEGAEPFATLDCRAYQSDDFIVGTPRYMSPEQTELPPSALAPAADIFSLGILFYQMLTGRLPFRGESLEELLFYIRETPAEDPRRVARGVHGRLAELVMYMLEKDPEDRPYDFDAVLVELAAFRGAAGEFPMRRFAAGESIFTEGDEAESAYVIVEGEVEIWTGRGGQRRVLGRHVEGEAFGELAVLRDDVRSASATALTDACVREIGREALEIETERLSPWVLTILSGVVERFVDRSERLVELLEGDDGP